MKIKFGVVGSTVVNGKAIVKSDFIPKNIALKAVEMARKEEREKAIEKVKMAYKNALYESEHNKGTYRSPIYIFGDLMNSCDELLNKEL